MRLIGHMLRPKNDHQFATAGDEQYTRDLAHYIFGTSREYEDTAFAEAHAFWWLIICILFNCDKYGIILLEVWDLRENKDKNIDLIDLSDIPEANENWFKKAKLKLF